MSIALTLAVTLAAALAQGIETNPLIVAVLALLAIPSVSSAATAVLRSASTVSGIKPQTILYGVSLALTGIVILSNGGELPLIDLENPAATMAGWLLWARTNADLAAAFYEAKLKGLLPAALPAPA